MCGCTAAGAQIEIVSLSTGLRKEGQRKILTLGPGTLPTLRLKSTATVSSQYFCQVTAVSVTFECYLQLTVSLEAFFSLL